MATSTDRICFGDDNTRNVCSNLISLHFCVIALARRLNGFGYTLNGMYKYIHDADDAHFDFHVFHVQSYNAMEFQEENRNYRYSPIYFFCVERFFCSLI